MIPSKFLRLLAFLFGGMVLLAACGDDAPSRSEAIDELVNDAGFDRPTAECAVDAILEELGSFDFVTQNEPTEEQSLALVNAFASCNALDDVLDATDTADGDLLEDSGGPIGGSEFDNSQGPNTPAPGTDAELDALWNGCAGGSAEDCDSLFAQSPLGSQYEDFGFYCGYRTETVESCSTLMG